MDKLASTFTRLDSAEPPKQPRTLEQVTDADIHAADGLVLIDPQQPDWQELLWSASIGDGAMTSMTLTIVEIAVDSRNQGAVKAARQRVRRIKGGAGPKKPR